MKPAIPKPSSASRYRVHSLPGFFVGLNWKVSLLSSLILLLVVTTFSWLNYTSLIDTIEQQRTKQYQRHAQEIESLIRRSSQNLNQLIKIIPYLKGMEDSLLTGNADTLFENFDRYWTVFQIQNDIEDVRFYDAAGVLLASWSNLDSSSKRDNLVLEYIHEVNHREQPMMPMICVDNCTQYTIEPLLINGIRVGVIAISSSLIDVFMNFQRSSGADIGLIVKHADVASSEPDSDMHISEWNSHITALTNSQQNLAILHQVAGQYPDLQTITSGVQIESDKRYYRIKSLPLHGISSGDQAQLINVTEISQTIQAIQESVWRIVVIGLIGLILSEIVLFSLLARSLSRLTHIVSTLPQLAGGGFSSFRDALAVRWQKRYLNDEIDLLYDASLNLSYRLEQLEEKVTYRTRMLVEQRNALSEEKNFVEHLLDTAQVIILTQDVDGRITMINAFGERLTHYNESELQGSYFLALLSSDSENQPLDTHLLDIQQGHRDQLRHDAIVVCKDHSKRHIAWLHSRIKWGTSEESSQKILSVGLDITEYKRVEGHLAWLADHDPLTNLYNRRRFSEELEQILELANRYQHPGALLFFDLDRFKYINDTSGHQTGDALLRMVANLLSQTIRQADISGRLGGDEFSVILPEITPQAAIEVAKKILTRLNEAQFKFKGHTYNIAASIGIAIFPDHGNNVHDLLAAADLAMYQAKETGRGTWHLFSDSDQSRERIHILVHWREKIEYAFSHNLYALYLQPVLSLDSNHINHYEVLLRMHDEDGTIHSPAQFISAAEQTGLIHKIDHMVLRKAVALAARINHQSDQRIGLSINLSAHAFNDPELLPIINSAIASCEIDPSLLMFEITETAALDNLPGTRSLLRELKMLGCGFTLDDFGVGFSSFYYLRELPVDAVKIDGSFIRNLDSNPDDRILVAALCSVARGFNKKITAEFVENQATLTMLKDLNIDFAQGYYIGKPVPAESLFPDQSH